MRRGSTIIRIAVLALATALLGAMLLFVGCSLRTMTGSAVRSVPLDWQAPVASSVQAARIARRQSGGSGRPRGSPGGDGAIPRREPQSPGRIDPNWLGRRPRSAPPDISRFPTLRLLHGGFRAGEIVLDQQLAATLQARIGDTRLADAGPTRAAAGLSGQRRRARHGPRPALPAARPADSARPPRSRPPRSRSCPFETFSRTYAPALRALSPASIGSSVVPGALNGVQWQVQAQVDPAGLGSTPAAACVAKDRSETASRPAPGTGVVRRQSLGRTHDGRGRRPLRRDALHHAGCAGGSRGARARLSRGTWYGERDRRDLVLLRARGASRRKLVAPRRRREPAARSRRGHLGSRAALSRRRPRSSPAESR